MADFDVNISDGTSVEVVITPASAAGAGVSDHGELTGLSDDDHTQYHTDTRGDARYKPLAYVPAWTDITGKPSVFPPDTHNHDALYSPLGHNHDDRYFTETEADARYLQSVPGSYATDAEVATAISDHEAVSDPHTGYQKESEKDQNNGYAGLNSSGRVPIARLASGTPDGTKFVRDDGTLVTPSGGGGNITGAYNIELNTSYTDAGMSDEFATNTLNAQWTVQGVNTTPVAGTADITTNPSTGIYDLTTRSQGILLQPRQHATDDMDLYTAGALASGESLVVSVSLPDIGAVNNYAFQVGINTGTGWPGTTNRFMQYSNTTIQVANQAGATLGSKSLNIAMLGKRMYWRISRHASNVYRWAYSFDGTSWNWFYTETIATTFTHLHVKAVHNGAATTAYPVIPVNWVRHVASVAHDPW